MTKSNEADTVTGAVEAYDHNLFPESCRWTTAM